MDTDTVTPIIVIGAATAFLEIYDLVNAINYQSPKYKIVGALDDDPNLHGKYIEGIPVLGGLELASSLDNVYFVFAICSYRLRIKRIQIFENLKIPRDRFVTLIHPTADISATAKIGHGVTIYGGVFIGVKTVISDFSVIYNYTFISPYASVNDFAMIAALAFVGAGAELDTGSFIGGKSALAPSCFLGAGAMIAFGSIAYENVPPKSFMIGNPAKLVKK